MIRPSDTAPNLRAGRRRGLRCLCELVLPGQAKRKASTLDIGVEGLSLVCAKPIAPGTRCRISFELPLGDRSAPVQGMLKTVYSSFCGAEGFRIGAVFIELDDSSATALREFSAPDA